MLQEYANILVPVDGSYGAEAAFEKAIAVAKRNNAHLHIVHAIDTRTFQDISSFDTEIINDVTSESKERLEKYVKEAHAAGIQQVDYSIEYGAPKTIIAKDLPKQMQTDLIMIGATGLNAVARLLVGSVTEYVTRNAQCDVLVVRTTMKGDSISAKQASKKVE
ncbi:universal stress protein [Fructilactobacillus florum]|uniref:Universal stress protein n=1 Tax=Fructilactobacillus florum DSM 22689 = JCM 16035 TaxID=1423745 RepID=A0A0R2CLH1_9LACO|nr:universal stress protein [Fructilactobacillus florum]KRM92446.1 universal stress protein [Fructilactobacillus florum DSM 22689 = JCM 16035]